RSACAKAEAGRRRSTATIFAPPERFSRFNRPVIREMPVLDTIRSDVRYALRWLRRSPGFTLVAVASLAIGIGFNTAIFTLVDALLFRPLPVDHPERLVAVYTSGADGDQYATT